MNGLGSVYKRGARWWIAYYFDGHLHRESARSKKESDAKALLKRRQRELGQGRAITNVEQVMLKDLLDNIAADYKTRKLASERTVRGHITALIDTFGVGTRAVQVTSKVIKTVVEEWQAAKVASATINKRLGTLRRAFRVAVAEGTFPSVPAMTRLPEDNVREGFWTKAELLAVLAHIKDEALADFILWSFYTGMRKGELSRMEWTSFDRETWTLILPGRITKNGKPKRLVLRGPLREIIERRLAARRLGTRRIFHREGCPIYEFRKAWRTACKKAGLAGKLFHDFRRTGVRNLVRAGVDRKVAMAISGHRTESIFSRYNIGDDADLADAVDKVTAYVERLPTEATPTPLAASR